MMVEVGIVHLVDDGGERRVDEHETPIESFLVSCPFSRRKAEEINYKKRGLLRATERWSE